MLRSTFSLAAHAWQISSMALLAPGTQWSHRPSDSLPAAWAPRTCGIASMAEAAAVVARNRRRESLLLRMSLLRVGVRPSCCGSASRARVYARSARLVSGIPAREREWACRTIRCSAYCVPSESSREGGADGELAESLLAAGPGRGPRRGRAADRRRAGLRMGPGRPFHRRRDRATAIESRRGRRGGARAGPRPFLGIDRELGRRRAGDRARDLQLG